MTGTRAAATMLPDADDAHRAVTVQALIAEARANARRRRQTRALVTAVIAVSIAPLAVSFGLLAGGHGTTAVPIGAVPVTLIRSGEVSG